MVWTPDKVADLETLWNKGMSITQIGKQLGLSRNAVVGKAHRIGLTKRESPIIRTGRPAAQAAKGPTCKWPSGDPKSANFGFCGKLALEGRPYCEHHCAVAYTTWGEEVPHRAKGSKAA